MHSVSKGPIYSCACSHTETQAADQTCYLKLSQNTDSGPTSPSTDPVTPGGHRVTKFKSLVYREKEQRRLSLEAASLA